MAVVTGRMNYCQRRTRPVCQMRAQCRLGFDRLCKQEEVRMIVVIQQSASVRVLQFLSEVRETICKFDDILRMGSIGPIQ